MLKILILGGTKEARQIADACKGKQIPAIFSYAGRTASPLPVSLGVRSGGFGGIDGLIRYLREENISHILDATHPFAEQISQNAFYAAQKIGLPLLRFERPAWLPQAEDRWIDVENFSACLPIIAGKRYRHIFLATGRQSLALFAPMDNVQFFARVIDKNSEDQQNFPHIQIIADSAPFDKKEEISLFKSLQIDLIIAKNAGGSGAYAKIEAARDIGIDVAMIKRPRPTHKGGVDFTTINEAIHHLLLLGV